MLHSRVLGDQAQLKEEMETVRRENAQLVREHNHLKQNCEELKRLHSQDQKELADLRLQQQQVQLRHKHITEWMMKLLRCHFVTHNSINISFCAERNGLKYSDFFLFYFFYLKEMIEIYPFMFYAVNNLFQGNCDPYCITVNFSYTAPMGMLL